MNTFIVIIGIIAIVGGGVAAFFAVIMEKKKALLWLTCGICCMLGTCLCILSASFKIVPTGYTGVRTVFGQVSEQPVTAGFNWKIPFIEQITLVNNKQQDVKISTEVWGETSERTPVFAKDVMVTYYISSQKSTWLFATVSTSTSNLIDQNTVSSAIKSAMVELSAETVTNRSQIEPLVRDKLADSLTEKYGEGTITVVKVVINQMDFEDSYNEAIAAKSIAQQTQEKQKIENDTAVAKAAADKQVAIAKAEAEAESARIRAEAEAEVTRITAQAEAEANKLLADSLTDAVIRAKFFDKWNGALPKVMSDGMVITDLTESFVE